MSSFAAPVHVSRSPPAPSRDVGRRANGGDHIGNQAALRLLSPVTSRVQARLEIGAIDDPLEHEADVVAGAVMRMAVPPMAVTPAPPQVNRKCSSCEEEDKAPTMQRKAAAAAAPVSAAAPTQVHAAIAESGRPLDGATRGFFEPRFGHDLGSVRIHDEGRAGEAARSVGARAFALGEHIVFAPGAFAPRSSGGRHLLAHELAHVVQQRGGLAPGRVQRAPPLLKQIRVDTPGPVTATATTAITPGLRLGTKFGTHGVNFTGSVIGGADADGEIFFSQVIRTSERRARMAKGGSTETFADRLDGGLTYKTTTQPVTPGTTVIQETDTPGGADSRLADPSNPGRASLRIKDDFDLYLMWRANSADPSAKWLTYGSVKWGWDAAATGLTTQPPTQLPWITPREPCKSLTQDGALSLVNGKASPATHLGLPINQSGRAAVAPFGNVFADGDAKDPDMEKGCS